MNYRTPSHSSDMLFWSHGIIDKYLISPDLQCESNFFGALILYSISEISDSDLQAIKRNIRGKVFRDNLLELFTGGNRDIVSI